MARPHRSSDACLMLPLAPTGSVELLLPDRLPGPIAFLFFLFKDRFFANVFFMVSLPDGYLRCLQRM